MEKRDILVLLLIVFVGVLIVAGLLFPGHPEGEAPYDISSAGWLNVSFTDALTGDAFTLQGLRDSGHTVLIQTFSVSCPICTEQLVRLSRIQETSPEEIAVVALALDPSVSDETLKNHAEENGFSGIMAASPSSLTTGLVQGWGREMLVPANAPVVIFCPGGNMAYKLRNGLKSTDEIMQSVRNFCV